MRKNKLERNKRIAEYKKMQSLLDKNEADNYRMNRKCEIMEKALQQIKSGSTGVKFASLFHDIAEEALRSVK